MPFTIKHMMWNSCRSLAVSIAWFLVFYGFYHQRFPPLDSTRHHHDTFLRAAILDEVFVKIRGKQHYLLRAVDQDGEVVDVFLHTRRNTAAANRFFRRLLKVHCSEPREIVTDKLRSYGVAHRELIPETIHDTSQYANKRAELSHQPTRVRERGMRVLKLSQQAQRFLGVHAVVCILFNLGRHLVSAKHYR